MCACLCVCACVYICVYVCVGVSICVRVCMHVYMCVFVYMNVHGRACGCICASLHLYCKHSPRCSSLPHAADIISSFLWSHLPWQRATSTWPYIFTVGHRLLLLHVQPPSSVIVWYRSPGSRPNLLNLI